MEYGKIFGSWQIRELIGKGSRERTRVYRITRNSHGILEEERALKTVTVCEAACLDKMTARARAEYDANRKVLCEKACNEVLLINRLEGEPHIVGCLDWELRDRTGGTDLLIAMHKVARNGLACYILNHGNMHNSVFFTRQTQFFVGILPLGGRRGGGPHRMG